MNANRISTKDIRWSSEKMFIEIGFFLLSRVHIIQMLPKLVVEIALCEICVNWDFRFNSPTSFEARISIKIFSALIPVTISNSNHPQIYFFSFRKHTKKVLPCLESKIKKGFYKCINSSKQLPIHTLFLENKRVCFGIGIFLKT